MTCAFARLYVRNFLVKPFAVWSYAWLSFQAFQFVELISLRWKSPGKPRHVCLCKCLTTSHGGYTRILYPLLPLCLAALSPIQFDPLQRLLHTCDQKGILSGDHGCRSISMKESFSPRNSSLVVKMMECAQTISALYRNTMCNSTSTTTTRYNTNSPSTNRSFSI